MSIPSRMELPPSASELDAETGRWAAWKAAMEEKADDEYQERLSDGDEG